MSKCPVCKDPLVDNGHYFLSKAGPVHWDCKKNLDLEELKNENISLRGQVTMGLARAREAEAELREYKKNSLAVMLKATMAERDEARAFIDHLFDGKWVMGHGKEDHWEEWKAQKEGNNE